MFKRLSDKYRTGASTACARTFAAERIAVQPPQAHRKTCQNTNDLAREAVGCNGGLGCALGGVILYI
jgi:hypothetical protein